MTVQIDVTEAPVFSLSIPSTSGSLWSNSDLSYEWALAGLPFLSVASDEFQLIRSFVPVNKQQTDNQSTIGEQSLTGWWLRSQRDFSSGAGLDYLEPAGNNAIQGDERVMRRFKSSYGVDVWTPGQVSLLNSMSAITDTLSSGVSRCVSVQASSTDYVYVTTGAGLKRSTGTSSDTVTGLTSPPSWLASNGSTVFAFHATGIDRIASGGTTAASAYTGFAQAGRGWWLKSRLMIALGSNLYAVDGTASGSALPAALSIQAPPTGWTWTSACETPSSFLFGGYAGSKSQIYKVNFDAATTSYSSSLVAELPAGEQVLGLYNYLGTYVGIGTNRGLRIGLFDPQSESLTYGPLTWSGGSVEHMVGLDRFLYVGVTSSVNGSSGLIRVDLSDPDAQGRYAWANDLSTGTTGTVDGVTVLGATSRLVVGVNTGSAYLQSSTDLVPSGRLVTGKVRFSTLEPKSFQFVTVRGTFSGGTVQVSTVQMDDSLYPLMTLSTEAAQSDIQVQPRAPVEGLGLQFDFLRGATATSGPVLRGWQFKALPAVSRKQQWRLPLLCWDQESDRFGAKFGASGVALARYTALRNALLLGTPVMLQDLIGGEQFTVLVEDVAFVQTSPPRGASGFGGVLIVQCREM